MKRLAIAVLVSMLLLVGSAAAQYATPGNPALLSADASIGEGVGTSPVVLYSWVLPDESPATGTQLEIIPSGERNDIYACIVVEDAESRDSIIDVFVDVYHPDDSFKYQVHARKLDPNNQRDAVMIEDCKDDALAAGFITSQDHFDIDYNIFDQPNWYMYKVYLPMYYHQPSGWYTTESYAVDSTSRISAPLSTDFEWVPGTYLELDFEAVSFGSIQPGFWKVLNGDTNMATPLAPTLKNEGNTEIRVGVEFSPFVGQGALPNKEITRFDAQLRNLGNTNYLSIPGEHLEFDADERVEFTHPISLCRQEKIDFSIHAPVGTVPDDYQGRVRIYATPVVVDAPPPGADFPVEIDGGTSSG
jgi:hypothetical protein